MNVNPQLQPAFLRCAAHRCLSNLPQPKLDPVYAAAMNKLEREITDFCKQNNVTEQVLWGEYDVYLATRTGTSVR